jgi:hypothetical protein
MRRTNVLAGLMLCAAACSAKKEPPSSSAPAPPHSSAAAPAAAEPMAALAAVTVQGRAADEGSPACGELSRHERDHWTGDRPPVWRDGQLLGCHFLEGKDDGEYCWSVDLSTATYATRAERHEAPPAEPRELFLAMEEISSPEGPPIGYKATTHRHGDLAIKLRPRRSSFEVCKGRRCTTYQAKGPVDQVVVDPAWTLAVGVSEEELVAADLATGQELYRIGNVGDSWRRGLHFQDGLLVVHRSTGTPVIEQWQTYELRTGEERCAALGRSGFDLLPMSDPVAFSITPTRWLVQVRPADPAPTSTNYEDVLLLQDPTTCQLAATLPPPLATEDGLAAGAPGMAVRMHPVLIQAGAQYVLAYPGGTVAIVEPRTLAVTRLIRPPACPRA